MSNFSGSARQDFFINSNNVQNYNIHENHPLIPNSQQYIILNKYVSIHSEDRNMLKYPESNEFEIELPEDIQDVVSLRLINWTFPANYNTFSATYNNISLVFSITNPYNPAAFGVVDDYNYKIYEALFITQEEPYIIKIEEGFYNPSQMTTELTNKMNYVVSKRISNYFSEKGWTDALNMLTLNGGYSRFVIVYNNVSSKIWFGNRADGFILLNQLTTIGLSAADNICSFESYGNVPDSTNWGLANNLGLTRCNTKSVSSSSLNTFDFEEVDGVSVPRFFYGDVTPGDNGYWLLPYMDFSGSEVHWVEPLHKINLMGEAFMYMEIDGQNCIDETQPFNFSDFTEKTNQTNGIVNSSFARLSIPTTPMSQWFDRDSVPYKFYYPPAERIRRLKIKIRYHNGRPVNFGIFNYSFMIQFTVLVPQIERRTLSRLYPTTGGR